MLLLLGIIVFLQSFTSAAIAFYEEKANFFKEAPKREDVFRVAKENQVFEDFVTKIQLEYANPTWVLLSRSEGCKGSLVSPRRPRVIIFWGAEMLLAFNGVCDQNGDYTLEGLFVNNLDSWSPMAVSFKADGTQKARIDENPKTCKGCHARGSTDPIHLSAYFDPYDFWPESYGMRHSRFTEHLPVGLPLQLEVEWLRFRFDRTIPNFYKALNGWKNMSLAKQKVNTNLLTSFIANQNNMRILSILKNRGNASKDYTSLEELEDNLKVIFDKKYLEDLIRQKKKSIEPGLIGLHRDQNRRFKSYFGYSSDFLIKAFLKISLFGPLFLALADLYGAEKHTEYFPFNRFGAHSYAAGIASLEGDISREFIENDPNGPRRSRPGFSPFR